MKTIRAASSGETQAGASPKTPARARRPRRTQATQREGPRRAERIQGESEERFRAIVEQSPFSTIVFSPSGDVIHVNEAHLRLWGVTRELAMQFNVFKDAQMEALGLWPFFRRAFAGERLSVPPIEYDLGSALGMGNKRTVQGDFYPLRDAEGKVTSVILVHQDVTQRRQNEEALRQSEQNYREVFNSTNDAIFVHDADTGAILDVNESVSRLFGFSRAEALRLTLDDISPGVSPYSAVEGRQRMAKAVAEGPQLFERQARKKQGDLFWVEVGMRCAEINGRRRILAVARDITERKRAAEVQRRSEANLQAILANTSDIIASYDRERRLVAYNEACRAAFRQMLGVEVYPGFRPLDVIPESMRAAWSANHARVLAGESFALEFELPATDGRRQVFETSYHPIRHQDEVVGFLTTTRNVTARKHAEERLRQQAALLDASHDAVMVWDIEQGVQLMNPAAQQLTGRALSQGRSQPLSAVLRSRSTLALEAAIREVTAKGTWSGELTLLGTAEQQRVVDSRWTLLPNAQGQPMSVLITCNDITERKRLEKQYLRAQRLESVGTLASGVAHDLNNILTPVLMAAELLGEQFQDAETRGVLDVIADSARRGVDTVKQLLTFARGADAQKGLVQPHHLLNEIARLLQQTFPKNIQIYTDYAQEPVTVLADPSQLHQVLMNLCVNARDAMPEGGALFLRLENRQLDDVGANIHPKARPQSYVVFKVTDSGTGILPEILDRIFDPFFTTKPQGKGTGLGLATVLGIVEDHGGFVLVESRPEQGTTFQVFLPASVATHRAAAPPEMPPRPQGHGELVLVVDDEAAILRLACEILRHAGYTTVSASNASEAFHLYERNRDRLRAVVTDIMMPFGDGRQLIATLLAQAPSLPIIAISGLATREFQRETLARGARAFLRKPFAADELLRPLTDLLAHPSSDPS